ncbi:hypothetical protein [Pseudomonas anguilliseptica]|uniref:hypothetical protein n=1 Tax=Pseudomonas anguilliseptica TaxID=53406 RepID=UPI001F20BE62|nr:hypothetical protein [Pseudomonas anguilliseptica]MCE5364477.1 hypothetical protein [Pseudomonas anguilliseptica]
MKSKPNFFSNYVKSELSTEKSISMSFEGELISSLSSSTSFAKEWISAEQEEGAKYLIHIMKEKAKLAS